MAGLSEAIECLRVPGASAAVSGAGLAATAGGPAEGLAANRLDTLAPVASAAFARAAQGPVVDSRPAP